jgi:hypothetical protein
MKTVLRKIGNALLICAVLSFTACKKDQYTATNTKRLKHQSQLKGKYNPPTERLAKGGKMKGDLR